MSRVNRRARTRLDRLSAEMAGYLTHGLIAATAPSEAEAKTAYRAHRTEVLAEELEALPRGQSRQISEGEENP